MFTPFFGNKYYKGDSVMTRQPTRQLLFMMKELGKGGLSVMDSLTAFIVLIIVLALIIVLRG